MLRFPDRPIALICNPETPRVKGFIKAMARLGLRTPLLLRYADVLNDPARVAEMIPHGSVLRLESPGRDFEVDKLMLRRGGLESIGELEFRKGEILFPRIWYQGWCEWLAETNRALAARSDIVRMNDFDEVATMFDKPTCQLLLNSRGIPVPRNFGMLRNFEELHELVRHTGARRLFLKIANGSSASGVVAYQVNNQGQQCATTTVEMARDVRSSSLRLFNSRKVRTYRRLSEISALIDALGEHVLHVEEWVPKASCGRGVFDLRIVVIAKRARNCVARVSRTPLTNLHLLNQRLSLDELLQSSPRLPVDDITATCERAMTQVFPKSLYAGFDVVVATGFRKHAVVEVNAFGDHLNDILSEGKTTHELELLYA